MALLTELVRLCAEHRVDSEASLSTFGRRLREAGRISMAGRGRGAAHMTYLDAARFLIACAATDRPEQAADAEAVFSNLKRADGWSSDENFPLPADEFPTLDVALAELFRLLADGEISAIAKARSELAVPASIKSIAEPCWLSLYRGEVKADLRVLKGDYSYFHKEMADLVTGASPLNAPMEGWSREANRFHTAKNLAARLERGLLQAVATLIKGDSE